MYVFTYLLIWEYFSVRLYFVCICNNLDVLIMVHVQISEILHLFPIFIHIANLLVFIFVTSVLVSIRSFNSNQVILSELLQ